MRGALIPVWCAMAGVALGASAVRADAPITLRYELESRQVMQGEPFDFAVVLVTSADHVDELALPDFDGLTVLRESRAQSSQVQIRGGARTITTEQRMQYVLRADEAGRAKIGEGMARVGSSVARAAPVTLDVLASDEPSPATGTASAGARFGRSPPPAFLEVTVDRREVFQGQQLTGTTELYVQQPLSQWPRVPGLKPQGFLCVSLLGEERPQPVQRTIAGKNYYVYLLNKDALFPLEAGTLKIPALQVDVVPAGSMFARGRALGAKSEAVPITVTSLPEADRPARFASSNVGAFQLEVSARPLTTTLGQPVTLSITATGRGLLERVELPDWDGGGNARVFPPTRRIERARSDEVVAGRVTAEMLVQPAREGTLTVPALSLWFFDPEGNGGAGAYAESKSAPLSILVRPPRAGNASAPDGDSAPRQLVARGARPLKARAEASAPVGAALREAPVLLGSGLAFAGAVALFVRRRRDALSRAPEGRATRARRDRAARLDEAVGRADLAGLEGALLDALDARFGSSVKSLPSHDLEGFLAGAGLDAARAAHIVSLIRDIESQRYAPRAQAERARLAQAVQAVVNELEGAP